MKSAFTLPPEEANSTRAFCVNPRLPPSPTVLQRSRDDADSVVGRVLGVEVRFSASTNARAAAPFQNKSTGACRIARMRSSGESAISEVARAARA